MSDINQIRENLAKMSDEDLEKLMAAIGVVPPKEEKQKKVRARKVVSKKPPIDKSNPPTIDPDTLINLENDPEVEQATKIEAKLKKVGKKRNVSSPVPRREVHLVKVRCKNCNRQYEVANNFPGIKDFICCIK